jgi:hypothetical protein
MYNNITTTMMYYVVFFVMVHTLVYDMRIIKNFKINDKMRRYVEPYKIVRNKLQEWMYYLIMNMILRKKGFK